MTLDECWGKAERGFAAEEHGYRASTIAGTVLVIRPRCLGLNIVHGR